jgi:hypothetical protein
VAPIVIGPARDRLLASFSGLAWANIDAFSGVVAEGVRVSVIRAFRALIDRGGGRADTEAQAAVSSRQSIRGWVLRR